MDLSYLDKHEILFLLQHLDEPFTCHDLSNSDYAILNGILDDFHKRDFISEDKLYGTTTYTVTNITLKDVLIEVISRLMVDPII